MIKVKIQKQSRVQQGDIIENVEYIEHVVENNGILEISKIEFPLVIVLTQDCDLNQDYMYRHGQNKKIDQDKYIISVLVAPIYNADHFFAGEHLSQLMQKMQSINKKKSPGTCILNNENPRYHYIEFPESIPIVPSIIDFKHYFSVNVETLKELKKDSFICKVGELYREQITLRFSNFLSRIGLPAE